MILPTMASRPMTAVALLFVLASGLAAQAGDGWSFVVLGHLRGDSSAPGGLNPLLPEIVEGCRRIGPELVFLSGDSVWGDYNAAATDVAAVAREWDDLDRELGRIGAPVHRVPGNHDINDLATRDLWFRRYPRLPQAVVHRRCLFLLLNSCWIPADGDRTKGAGVRGVALDDRQVAFLRERIAGTPDVDHVFLVLHHVAWWDEDASWWKRVHPALAGTRVRAVFAGDYGPRKFSHLRRDGIDYVQACVETDPGTEMLRVNEAARLLSEPLDVYLEVRVEGPSVRIEARTAGLTSGRHAPARWREVNDLPPAEWVRYNAWDTTRRKRLLAIGLAGSGFLAGAVTMLVLLRLFRRRSSRRAPLG